MTNADNVNPGLLARLLGGITGGGITVIDLTMTLDQKIPTIVLPPELGQSWPFRMEEIFLLSELMKPMDLRLDSTVLVGLARL